MMKKLSKVLFLMVMELLLSVGVVYANTNGKEEQSKEELWISDFATDENSSKGSVIENVDKDGKEIDAQKEDFIDVRQFVTFKTKSGKTLHLIIDHSKNGENVKLLTEVSEFDLLNMVEENEMKKLKTEDENKVVKKEVEKVEEKTEDVKPTEDKKMEDEQSNHSLYLIFGVLILVFVGAGYYFKVYKKKNDGFEDDEDYDELEEDDYEFDDSEPSYEEVEIVEEDIEIDEVVDDEEDE